MKQKNRTFLGTPTLRFLSSFTKLAEVVDDEQFQNFTLEIPGLDSYISNQSARAKCGTIERVLKVYKVTLWQREGANYGYCTLRPVVIVD